MINFGSAADKLSPEPRRWLTSRYKGPPIKVSDALSIGSLTPGIATPRRYASSGYDTPAYVESIASESSSSSRRARKSRHRSSRHRFNRPSLGRNHGSDDSYDVDAHAAFYADWDLVPTGKEKMFPNWGNIHHSVPETLGTASSRTLNALTESVVVNNQPTIPRPRDLAIINILKKKLGDWEKDEEDLYVRREGWFSHSEHAEEKARRSWVRTQNRDFGSAVWRWMRLNNWDATQTPRMKGLYNPR